MAAILWLTTIIVLLDAAHSYILLTANMDDVQAIAKQMLSSPVVGQLGKIWRRATAQFNQRLKKTNGQKRSSEDNPEAPVPTESRSRFLTDSFRRRGRRVIHELSELTSHANEYLQYLRRAFEGLTKEHDTY